MEATGKLVEKKLRQQVYRVVLDILFSLPSDQKEKAKLFEVEKRFLYYFTGKRLCQIELLIFNFHISEWIAGN